jgi:hypothetical protein
MIRRRSAPHSKRVGVIQSAGDRGAARAREWAEFVQCCHCQYTAAYTPGLERVWGVCWRCADWHCPKKACRTKCVPVQRWLDNRRKGLPDDHVPIMASVPAEPPRSAGGVYLG